MRSCAGVITSGLLVLSLTLLGGCRGGISEKPPVHLVLDMDFQPKLKAQSSAEFPGWEDSRGMRPQVAGTIPRGGSPAGRELGSYYVPEVDEAFASYDMDDSGTLDWVESEQLLFGDRRTFAVSDHNHDGELDVEEVTAATKLFRYRDEDGYVTENPLPATREVLERGRERFTINCATCHGVSGKNGMVARRWPVPVPDLVEHADQTTRLRLINLPFGELFETMTKGKGTMPAYGYQVSVPDRWAIAHYVKALQQHFN